jgi:hypothetical protein
MVCKPMYNRQLSKVQNSESSNLTVQKQRSTSSNEDLIFANNNNFKKLFQKHVKTSNKKISFSEIIIISKKIGLFPEFINYKEIKDIVAGIKGINHRDVSSK